MAGKEFIKIDNISKQFPGSEVAVLKLINLSIANEDYISILGPSGSGKSTLLRIITGLSMPTAGKIVFDGKEVTAPNPYSAIVFQNAALYPWLTVQENVELGLKAKGFPKEYTNDKANSLIELIGLEGYEEAYPKELSGGMRQRVGFARALAVEPKLLCLDEPFSALDYLTAENLRTELVELWTEKRVPIRAIIHITHNIEEAVLMSDRVVILSKGPAVVLADIPIRLPHPRNRKSREFEVMVDYVYKVMTGRQMEQTADARIQIVSTDEGVHEKLKNLPQANPSVLWGLLEMLDDADGKVDIYRLGRDLLLESDELLPSIEALSLIGFAEVKEGDIFITDSGHKFVDADIDDRKVMFCDSIKELPVFRVVINVLHNKKNNSMNEQFFVDLFLHQFTPQEVEKLMQTIISWGRYAELFNYDYDSEMIYIEAVES